MFPYGVYLTTREEKWFVTNCVQCDVRMCIQKFPDSVDNEINNSKHSVKSNTKGYGGKTH
jgi:hypothetical protein